MLGEYRRHPSEEESAVAGRSPGVCQPLDADPLAELCAAELAAGSPNRRHPPLPAVLVDAGALLVVAPLEAASLVGREALVDGVLLARPLICARLRCCCANGTRFTAAGGLWLKNLVLLKFVVLRAVTARSENRRLEAVGATGTCPRTKLADRSCSGLTRIVLVNRPLANSLALTPVTPFATRAFR